MDKKQKDKALLEKCPFDPKPKCKDCTVHCYAEPYRTTMKEVMTFSSIYLVKRGRMDWLFKVTRAVTA